MILIGVRTPRGSNTFSSIDNKSFEWINWRLTLEWWAARISSGTRFKASSLNHALFKWSCRSGERHSERFMGNSKFLALNHGPFMWKSGYYSCQRRPKPINVWGSRRCWLTLTFHSWGFLQFLFHHCFSRNTNTGHISLRHLRSPVDEVKTGTSFLLQHTVKATIREQRDRRKKKTFSILKAKHEGKEQECQWTHWANENTRKARLFS